MSLTTRAVVASVAAAAFIMLAGCSPSPVVTDDGRTPPATDGQTVPEVASETVELVGTTWSGSDDGNDIEMTFTLEADGTVLFDSWNGEHYDSPSDTWSQSGSTFTMYVSNITDIGGITYTGEAALGTMSLDGRNDLGDTDYGVTITQQ